MANIGYLLNTGTLTSDVYWLFKQLEKPGNDILRVAESAWMIPVPWLCCFRPEDLRVIDIPNSDDEFDDDDDDDDDEAPTDMKLALPCTTVKQAIENKYHQSAPLV